MIAPSILIDDLELHPVEEELPKLPVVSAAGHDAVKAAQVLRLLGRYIFREILSSALLGTLLATFVIFLQRRGPALRTAGRQQLEHQPDRCTCSRWRCRTVLPLTIPFGVLVGILIGLGRLASDGEITAMRAAGVSSRKVIAPVLLFAALGTGVAALASLRLTPYSLHREHRHHEPAGGHAAHRRDPAARLRWRTFPTRFSTWATCSPGPVVWRNIFMADVTPPEQRSQRHAREGATVR